jgi:hypothetical protein
VVVSGAHAASVPLVVAGGADLAAIDAVSWRLARRFLPEAGRLRVLMLTEPTPGLPYVAAAGVDTRPHADALEAAGGDGELGLVGFARLPAEAWELVARRFAAAAGRLGGDVALAG